MSYKYLYLLLVIFLIGCQASGIRPIPNSELNGKTKPASMVSNAPVEKQITIVIPKKTNTLVVPVQEVKKAVENNKPLKLNIVSEPVTNKVILQNNPPEVVGKNFLIWWYGTIVIGVAAILYFKGFLKKKVKKDKITQQELNLD